MQTFIRFVRCDFRCFVLRLGVYQILGASIAVLLVTSPRAIAETPTEIVIDDPLPAEIGERISGAVLELNSATLRESGFETTDAVFDRLPNITWSAGTSRPRFLFIRGIGDLDQYAGSGLPAVSVIGDGLNLSGLAQALSLFDTRVAKIERGPTGFFGGPSSLAGLITFESGPEIFDPLERNSLIEGGVGSGGYRAIAARSAFGVPESFGILTAEHNYRDGFLRNGHLGRANTNQQETTALSAGYNYRTTAGDSLELRGISRSNNDGYDAFAIDNTRTVRSDRPGSDDLDLAGGALRGTKYITNALRLDIEGSSLRAESEYSYDGDWGNDSFWFPNLPYDFFSSTERDRHLSSAGAKLTFGDSVGVMAQIGVFYQRLSEASRQTDFASNEPYRRLDSDFRDERTALFGSVSKTFGASTRGWVATRFEQQRAELDFDSSQRDADEHAPLFQAGVEYSVSPDIELYVKSSRGWRGGGFNVGAAIPSELIDYEPEFLTEFSAGARIAFPKHEASLELSAFRGIRHDQQVRLELQTNPADPLSFIYVTGNAANGENLGLEAIGNMKLTRRLAIDGSAALLQSTFSDVSSLGRQALDGRDTALTPSWRANLDARYALSDRWFTRIGLVATDQYYFDDSNDAKARSLALLNTSIGYETSSWSVTLWLHNLLDRRYPVRGFFFGNEPPNFEPKRYIQRGAPLNGGITVSYRF